MHASAIVYAISDRWSPLDRPTAYTTASSPSAQPATSTSVLPAALPSLSAEPATAFVPMMSGVLPAQNEGVLDSPCCQCRQRARFESTKPSCCVPSPYAGAVRSTTRHVPSEKKRTHWPSSERLNACLVVAMSFLISMSGEQVRATLGSPSSAIPRAATYLLVSHTRPLLHLRTPIQHASPTHPPVHC